jgi:hypothetical protein
VGRLRGKGRQQATASGEMYRANTMEAKERTGYHSCGCSGGDGGGGARTLAAWSVTLLGAAEYIVVVAVEWVVGLEPLLCNVLAD